MNEFNDCPIEGAIGLLALLIRSGRIAESRLDYALGRSGLTFVKWRTLDTLVKAKCSIPLKALPGELNCVKSNITQLVDKLESEGLVRRVPDPEDRRGTRIELTDVGHKAHEAGHDALRRATSEVFASINEPDRDLLRRQLLRLTDPGV